MNYLNWSGEPTEMKNDKLPTISIVTPSLNMLDYLKGCVLSVSDQQGVMADHTVIDGGSTDGSREWLEQRDGIRYLSEPDAGMYDALNKGFRMAEGDILGYLNCDEQYLPGTLLRVSRYFRENPDVDLVFGDILLINPEGNLLAFRKGYPFRWFYVITSHLYNFSCAIFFRRRLLGRGFRFNTEYRAVGDMDLFVRMMREGIVTRHIRQYFSTFIITGNNMGFNQPAMKELNRLKSRAPVAIIKGRYVLNILRLLEKALHGSYFQGGPINYSVYPIGDTGTRKKFSIGRASSLWPKHILK